MTSKAAWLGILVVLLVGCSEKNECESVCRRVARCRQEARVGDKIMGEGDLPADARCMKRCRDEPDVWASCEKAKRSCEALRGCYGPLR